MSAPNEPGTRPAPRRGPVRRIAATLIMSALVFVALWLMAFSLLTSLIISSGCCVVLVAASSISDLVEMVLDAIAAVVFGILAAIAAIVAGIFAIFGF